MFWGFFVFTHNRLGYPLPEYNKNKMQDVRTKQLHDQLVTTPHIWLVVSGNTNRSFSLYTDTTGFTHFICAA